MAFSLLSLASFPPTGGFLAKLYLFSSAVDAGKTYLAVIGVVATVVSLGYYLRFTLALYTRPAGGLALVRSAPGTVVRDRRRRRPRPRSCSGSASPPAPMLDWARDAARPSRCDLLDRRLRHPHRHMGRRGRLALARGRRRRAVARGRRRCGRDAGADERPARPARPRADPSGLERARDARPARRGRPRPGRSPDRHRRRARPLGEPYRRVLPAVGRGTLGTGLRRAGRPARRAERDRRDRQRVRAEPGTAHGRLLARPSRRRRRRGRSPRPSVGGDPRRGSGQRRRLGQRRARPARRRSSAADRRARTPARAAQPLRRLVARGVAARRSKASCSTSCATCSRASGIRSPPGREGVPASLRTWVATENLAAPLVGRDDARSPSCSSSSARRGLEVLRGPD